ncbi:MAG: hypothetical protein GWO07_03855 [Candidatus Dadabacteria bacterium]|nr:hypothetical protein [Candidatus Dadabacteria bacterium]NIV42924.1 hypothetical protein [Candidatus Dadabacteria bacterium]NIX14888.1 hypothetical protein [Candidatus Dadabacteria bacterium]
MEGQLPKDHCQGASFNNPYCDPYIGKGESKTFKNPKDYKCGEYPVGTTHYDDTSNNSNKMLASFWFWNRRHDFKMGRVGSQTSPSFSTYDLSAKGTANRTASSKLSSESLWLSLNPGQNSMDIYMCTYLPGTTLDGPVVDYDPKDTFKWLITKISWPDVSFNQAKVCAKTKLSVNKDLKPTMKWDVTNLELKGSNVGNVNVTKSAYFYAAAVATAGIAPLVGPLGHFVIATVQTAVTFEMIAEQTVETFINHTNNDDYIQHFMPDKFKKEMLKNLSDKLNAATGQALASVPDAKGRIKKACDAMLPSVAKSNPLYYFYKYVKNQCTLLTTEYTFYPFVANQGSANNGCYGTNKFFTPYDYNKGAWWTTITGQEWYFPIMKDSGCRLDTVVENSKLDSAVWPVLRCSTFVLNAHLNGLLNTSLTQGMTNTCGPVGLNSMLDLYGNGKDLYELYMSKHGGDGGPGGTIKLK